MWIGFGTELTLAELFLYEGFSWLGLDCVVFMEVILVLACCWEESCASIIGVEEILFRCGQSQHFSRWGSMLPRLYLQHFQDRQ